MNNENFYHATETNDDSNWCPDCGEPQELCQFHVDDYMEEIFEENNNEGWDYNCGAFQDEDGNWHCGMIGSEYCDWECGNGGFGWWDRLPDKANQE